MFGVTASSFPLFPLPDPTRPDRPAYLAAAAAAAAARRDNWSVFHATCFPAYLSAFTRDSLHKNVLFHQDLFNKMHFLILQVFRRDPLPSPPTHTHAHMLGTFFPSLDSYRQRKEEL